MFSRILDLFFGCAHGNISFPMTIKKGARSRAAFPTGTYVVCLDCGKEMPYDWKAMKVVNITPERAPVVSLATKEAA
jgi:ribosomal protein S26